MLPACLSGPAPQLGQYETTQCWGATLPWGEAAREGQVQFKDGVTFELCLKSHVTNTCLPGRKVRLFQEGPAYGGCRQGCAAPVCGEGGEVKNKCGELAKGAAFGAKKAAPVCRVVGRGGRRRPGHLPGWGEEQDPGQCCRGSGVPAEGLGQQDSIPHPELQPGPPEPHSTLDAMSLCPSHSTVLS